MTFRQLYFIQSLLVLCSASFFEGFSEEGAFFTNLCWDGSSASDSGRYLKSRPFLPCTSSTHLMPGKISCINGNGVGWLLRPQNVNVEFMVHEDAFYTNPGGRHDDPTKSKFRQWAFDRKPVFEAWTCPNPDCQFKNPTAIFGRHHCRNCGQKNGSNYFYQRPLGDKLYFGNRGSFLQRMAHVQYPMYLLQQYKDSLSWNRGKNLRKKDRGFKTEKDMIRAFMKDAPKGQYHRYNECVISYSRDAIQDIGIVCLNYPSWRQIVFAKKLKRELKQFSERETPIYWARPNSTEIDTLSRSDIMDAAILELLLHYLLMINWVALYFQIEAPFVKTLWRTVPILYVTYFGRYFLKSIKIMAKF